MHLGIERQLAYLVEKDCSSVSLLEFAGMAFRRRARERTGLVAEQLADRKLRGPGTRSEMRDLREQIGERSTGLDRLHAELDDAHSGMRERGQFQADHAHEAALLEAVNAELDDRLHARALQVAENPSAYHLHILGPVPDQPDHLATWIRGATILDRHYLGLDREPAQRERSPLLGGRREKAEMMARLEVMAIPPEVEPVQSTIEQDLGLDLI